MADGPGRASSSPPTCSRGRPRVSPAAPPRPAAGRGGATAARGGRGGQGRPGAGTGVRAAVGAAASRSLAGVDRAYPRAVWPVPETSWRGSHRRLGTLPSSGPSSKRRCWSGAAASTSLIGGPHRGSRGRRWRIGLTVTMVTPGRAPTWSSCCKPAGHRWPGCLRRTTTVPEPPGDGPRGGRPPRLPRGTPKQAPPCSAATRTLRGALL